MAEIIPMHDETGHLVSGGEIPHGSTNFWGIEILSRSNSKRAHFWRLAPFGYERECDGWLASPFLWNGQCSIFAPGNYPKCKRCMQRLTRGPNAPSATSSAP